MTQRLMLGYSSISTRKISGTSVMSRSRWREASPRDAPWGFAGYRRIISAEVLHNNDLSTASRETRVRPAAIERDFRLGWRSIPKRVERHAKTSKIDNRFWKRLCRSNDLLRSGAMSRARLQSPREPVPPGTLRPCLRLAQQQERRDLPRAGLPARGTVEVQQAPEPLPRAG
jgi:hypothetical protein